MTEATMRKTSYTQLSNILSMVNAHQTTPLTYGDVETLLERSNTLFKKCEELTYTLIKTCVDDAAIELQTSSLNTVEKVYLEIQGKLKNLQLSLPLPVRPGTDGGDAHHTGEFSNESVILPKFDLPIFDGTYHSWLSFRDLFLATIDKHSKLSPAMKLQYLKGKLAQEPSNLISSLMITDANYKEAWKLLNDRYSNDREIVFSLVDKIVELKPITTENASGLQNLLDTTTKSLRTLAVMGIPTEKWDVIIISFLLKKIDSATRREWAIRLTGTKVPTFREFSEFLANHIRGLNATGKQTSTAVQGYRRSERVGSHHVAPEPTCPICKGHHKPYHCEQLKHKSPKERNTIAQQYHLCFNCLSKHKGKCLSTQRCRTCNGKHHTLLHETRSQSIYGGTTVAATTTATGGIPHQTSAHSQQQQQQQQQTTSTSVSLTSHYISTQKQVLLSTVVANVEDRYGAHQPCRIFLDPGSEASFITETCVNRLGLQRSPSNIKLTGIGATHAGNAKGIVYTKLHSGYREFPPVAVEFHILPKITGLLPRFQVEKLEWPHLYDLQLADPTYDQPQPIDMLLGADYCGFITLSGRRTAPSPTHPVAQETIFGWVISGQVPVAPYSIRTHHISTNQLLQKFWEVEETPKIRILTKEEKAVEEHFKKTYSRDGDGRFVVGIPFNAKQSQLGNSKSTAIRRFHSIERKLQRNPQHKKQYVDFMREYLQLGHMQEVPPQEDAETPAKTFYLPHHYVVNEGSSTTKLRVVFDGSAKSTSGVSLNDTMMIGATLQDDLFSILLRFRIHPIVLKADITKMYRQFRLSKEDADYHRILWREAPEDFLKTYRLTTVTYGTACAPNLATRCLQQLAVDCQESHPTASRALYNDSYIDDIMTGGETEEAVVALYQELTAATATAGLELRKWSSNNSKVIKTIPQEFLELDPQGFTENSSVKALGIKWHPSLDVLKFNYIEPTTTPVLTKRILLSDLARVFDPLGLLSAITIQAKMLLQELWSCSIGWDEAVPEHLQTKWLEFQEGMKQVYLINIPRCITLPQSSKYHYHGFCDASEKAYGATIYLRTEACDGSVSSHLITSKTRVAPLQQHCLPRLELM